MGLKRAYAVDGSRTVAYGMAVASLFLIIAFPVALLNEATVWEWVWAVLGAMLGIVVLWGALIRVRQPEPVESAQRRPSVWGIFGVIAVVLVAAAPGLVLEPGVPSNWIGVGGFLSAGFALFSDEAVDKPLEPSLPRWKLAANLLAACCFAAAFVVKARTAVDDIEWSMAVFALVIAGGLVLHAVLQWRYPLRPPWPGVRRQTLCAVFALGVAAFVAVMVLTKLPDLSAREWGKAGLFLWAGTSWAITIGESRVSSGRHAENRSGA